VIGRGIARVAFGSGLTLSAPPAFSHEAAFHGPALLAGVINYLSQQFQIYLRRAVLRRVVGGGAGSRASRMKSKSCCQESNGQY